jgi:hypothetical protein
MNYPRTNYEMSEQDLKELLDSCRPTPCIQVGGVDLGRSAQDNANLAWERLGHKMGFDWNTVQSIAGKGNRFFSAIPLETDEHRKAREETEAEERRVAEIKKLKSDRAGIDSRLTELISHSITLAHRGDPCIYCNVAHDDVAPGPCPARVAELERTQNETPPREEGDNA